MNKIIAFFVRHIVFFQFVLLEAAAFVLIVNANEFQKSVFFRHATAVMARIYSVTGAVGDYFGLREVNDALARENAGLRNEIEALKEQVAHLTHDTLIMSRRHPDLRYIEAKVVYNSVYHVQNYIIIDKGAEQGVEPDMGVVSPDGVVGVVQRVSDNFAVVIPVINPIQRISAKTKADNQLGSLVWNGRNTAVAQMEEIPGHVKPEVGDSIVTSGYSAIFPAGIYIGSVSKVYGGENDPFCKVDVRLGVDFHSIEYVMVAVYKNRAELSELEKTIEHDE
ncbi:MAG: rod shape-determining protein MreC [bacterium]|uniref:Cell shape-determining protein MreC n=1 Tax=Candidatus Aphodosoma intestinipullorum TaxID=2840674 RepID=A0A940IF98_9BACT|nr:rod shape-determining protein MreC [Candidatus Aphodosoma intestinipullorum]